MRRSPRDPVSAHRTRERGGLGREYVRGWASTDDLSRKASLNGVAAILDYLARVAVQFLINPLLVRGLGTVVFGAWRVLWQLGGYLWATSGRSAQALQWVLSSQQRSKDVERKRQYVASAVLIWALFLPVLAFIGGLIAWFAPVFMDVPETDVSSLRLAGVLLTLDALALTLLTIPRAVLQGQNLGYKRMGLSALLILFGGVLMALAVVGDRGVVGVALANLVTTVMTGVLFWSVAKRQVSWFGLTRPAKDVTRRLLGLSGWFMAWKLVYEFMLAADVVVLGFFVSVELVTDYTLTKAIPEALIVYFTLNVLQGTGPGLAGIIGQGDLVRGVKVRNEIMVITWLAATVVGATVLVWNRSFIGLWVGGSLYAGGLATLLIVVLAMQFLFISNDARVIDMTLNVRTKVLTGAIAAAASFALALILVRRVENQIVGMCLGLILGRSIMSIAYPVLAGRVLGQSFGRQLRGAVRPAMVTALAFGSCLAIGARVLTESWIELLALGSGTAAALGLLCAVLGLTAAQRRSLLHRVTKTVGGPRRGRPSSEKGQPINGGRP